MRLPEHIDGSPIRWDLADEETRLNYEVLFAVDRVLKTLPPEGVMMGMRNIVFEPEHAEKGYLVISAVGTVVHTPEENRYRVPERTLEVLRQLQVPFSLHN